MPSTFRIAIHCSLTVTATMYFPVMGLGIVALLLRLVSATFWSCEELSGHGCAVDVVAGQKDIRGIAVKYWRYRARLGFGWEASWGVSGLSFSLVYRISGTEERIYLEVCKMLCGKRTPWTGQHCQETPQSCCLWWHFMVGQHGLTIISCHWSTWFAMAFLKWFSMTKQDVEIPSCRKMKIFQIFLICCWLRSWRCFGMDTLLKICSVKCYLLHLERKRRSPQRVVALLETTCSSATGSNSTNPPEKYGNSTGFMRTDIWGWIRHITRRKNFPLYWTIGSWILHFWEKQGWYDCFV